MKVTYNWLKEYIPLEYPIDKVADVLTMLGMEVEAVEKVAWNFSNVVVGKIVDIKSLSETKKKLSLCKVTTGDKTLDIVCGAPNIALNQAVPVALVGAKLPTGIDVTSRKFGDIVSNGMICSEMELGLSERADGIMVLDNATIGSDLKSWLGPEDWIIELDITANRPDCLSVVGIARDLAAKLKLPLNLPKLDYKETSSKTAEFIDVEIVNPDGCPRYSARYLSGIKVEPSPWWLVYRLHSVGVRSINNIVDVTNYILMELGQPLHAFDYTMVSGGKIIVRNAKKGEKFITLDEKEHSLHDDTLLICDAEKPVALAGVMGGLNSEVSDTTNAVLLESAYFSPQSTRKTSNILGISTEASYRFERGIDPNGVVFASNRASQLMAEVCSAQIAEGVVDIYAKKIEKKTIPLRNHKVTQLLGVEIPRDNCAEILRGLGAEVTENNELEVTVPTFRPDLEREVDLIEEVARVWSYDEIPANTVVTSNITGVQVLSNEMHEHSRQCLLGLGYNEVINLSLLNPKLLDGFIEKSESAPTLVNPISEEYSTLRPSLLPLLLTDYEYNKNRGNTNIRIFEIGHCFSNVPENDIKEWNSLAGLVVGTNVPESWDGKNEPFSIFHLKGHIEVLLKSMRLPSEIQFKKTFWEACNQSSLGIYVNNTLIGEAGKLSAEISKRFDLETFEVFIFEINLDTAERMRMTVPTYKKLSKFPPALRDLSFVVDRSIEVGDILSAIWKNGGNYLNDAQLIDVFTGKQILENQKSLTFSLVYLNEKRTLRDEEVEESVENIITAMKSKFDASLRN